MRKLLKWVMRGVAALLVVGVILAAFNWEKLVRLYHVNTLFDEENIVENFSHMENLFFNKPVKIKAGSQPTPEPEIALAPLPQSYSFMGKDINLEKRLGEFRTTSLLVIHKGENCA